MINVFKREKVYTFSEIIATVVVMDGTFGVRTRKGMEVDGERTESNGILDQNRCSDLCGSGRFPNCEGLYFWNKINIRTIQTQ